jgi:hypothetical protein
LSTRLRLEFGAAAEIRGYYARDDKQIMKYRNDPKPHSYRERVLNPHLWWGVGTAMRISNA